MIAVTGLSTCFSLDAALLASAAAAIMQTQPIKNLRKDMAAGGLFVKGSYPKITFVH
jgi:hypothetical protein